MSTNNHAALIAKLRSAAYSLSVEGIANTRSHKLPAELIELVAHALATAYASAQMAESFRAGLATAAIREDVEGDPGGRA